MVRTLHLQWCCRCGDGLFALTAVCGCSCLWLLCAASPPLKALSGSKVLPDKAQYAVKRTLDAWKYGSGADFKL
jgi:hypothetical protein